MQGSTWMGAAVGATLGSRPLLWHSCRQTSSKGICKGAMLLATSPGRAGQRSSTALGMPGKAAYVAEHSVTPGVRQKMHET